jgi:hypothetical protein
VVPGPQHLDHQVTGALDAFLRGELAPGAFALRYDIGDDFSGETHVRLAGDGRYDVRSTATADGSERTYDGSVDPARVREVAATWSAAHVETIAHFRQRATDDPPARLTVEHDGAETAVKLWVSEIVHSDAFQAAQAPMLALAHDVSNGEVLELGR